MKKKVIYLLFVSFFILLGVIFLGGSKAYAIGVGDQLLNPERGWVRYEDTNSNITYTNGSWNYSANYGGIFTGSHVTWSTYKKSTCRFNFNGSKIRIISDNINHDTNCVEVKIDGEYVGTFSEYRSYEIGSIVCFERTDLSEGEHSIEMTTVDTRSYTEFVIDAIDVAKGAELYPFHEIRKNTILKVIPKIIKINKNNEVNVNLTIGNINNISSESMIIKYDSTKLKFLGADTVEGSKLVRCKNKNGELQIVTAGIVSKDDKYQAIANLRFQCINLGNALIKIEKAFISDDVSIDRDLEKEELGEEIIFCLE